MGHIDNVDTPAANTVANTTPVANTMKQSTTWHHSQDNYISDDNNNANRHTVLDDVVTTNNLENEPWFTARWRPCIAWLYFCICAFDFIIAPIFTFWFAYASGQLYHQWQPITLQGGGLIHVSLGAIIGVYAWQRTKEKLAGVPASFGIKPTTE